jgi:hypothetical protein
MVLLQVADHHASGHGIVAITDADRAEKHLALGMAENELTDSFPEKRQGVDRSLTFQPNKRPAQFDCRSQATEEAVPKSEAC